MILPCRPEAEYLAAYITELTLPDYNALMWFPSMIAAAAVFVARYTCVCAVPALRRMPIWNPTLTHYTRYRCLFCVSIACAMGTMVANFFSEYVPVNAA